MSSSEPTSNPWHGDLLGFSKYGETFTSVIKSIDDSKVISIEAGFGHGKTFFRKAWAEHLRHSGELVVEIDAQQSDHSGEPIITFLGALLALKCKDDKPLIQTIGIQSLKIAGAASRALVRAVLRSGADEGIETISDHLSAKAEGSEVLQGAIDELEEGMSKLAGQMVASQLAAEHARKEELPAQIDSLRATLVEGRPSDRIVIIIDELDRCHPEYAIALLEAMKLVFGRPGFVFCLMVNADYLESIAHHRFGTKETGEGYLDKFVDIRLSLSAGRDRISAATQSLASTLPLNLPFGDDPAFTVKAAADLAGMIALSTDLSVRQIKKVLSKVDLALRCYRDKPLDAPLLVFLAFAEVARRQDDTLKFDKNLLPRAGLTADRAESVLSAKKGDGSSRAGDESRYYCEKFISDTCPELRGPAKEHHRLPTLQGGRDYYEHYKLLAGLAPHYLAEHMEVLGNVHKLMAS